MANTGPSLIEAYRLGLKHRESWLQAKDRRGLQCIFDAVCRTPGVSESTPVASLTRDRVRELRSLWMQEGGRAVGSRLSASSINKRLSLLTTLLELCDLPPHTVQHLSTRGTRRKRRISDAELQSIASWAASSSMKGAKSFGVLCSVALETAARQGELLGLQWAAVVGDTVTFKDTKNGDTRTVPLTAKAQALLEARRGLPAPFSDLHQARVCDLWDTMRTSLGLAGDDEFVFHTLRHEAISRLADKGVNAFVIQAIAGHSNITTTQVYAKASLGAMRGALFSNAP